MNNTDTTDDFIKQVTETTPATEPNNLPYSNPIIQKKVRKYSRALTHPISHFKGLLSGLTKRESIAPPAQVEPATTTIMPFDEPVTERPQVPAVYHVNAMKVRKRIIQSKEQLAARKDKKYPFIFDSHFHVENYRQQGVSVAAFLNMMDNVGVSKAVLFGLPLRQTVLFTEQEGGNYYTDSDLPLYYYAGTDYSIAEQYRHLTTGDKEKLYPMITGINPADVGAVDDIMRLLHIYPKTFVGIGEITVHKEIVTAKIAGEKPSLYSDGLNNIFAFAGRVGLVCLLHNDIDTMMAKDDQVMPRYFKMLLKFFHKHKDTQIIWAHCGLGRYVTFDDKYIPLLDKLLATCPNVHVDIAWDEVAKYIVKDTQTTEDWVAIICKYPDRFLYGSDLIAPKDSRYLKTFNHYKPLLDRLPTDVAYALTYGNALRIFERARKEVNQWTDYNVTGPGIIYEKADETEPLPQVTLQVK